MLKGTPIEVSSTPLPCTMLSGPSSAAAAAVAAAPVTAACVPASVVEEKVERWQATSNTSSSPTTGCSGAKNGSTWSAGSTAVSAIPSAENSHLSPNLYSRDSGFSAWVSSWLPRFSLNAYQQFRRRCIPGRGRIAAAAHPPANAVCSADVGDAVASFGDAPATTICFHCHKAITTTVSYRISCFGIAASVLSPFLLGWPGLFLSPFLWMALKDAVHTCPACRNLLHRQSRVSIPFVGARDEVVTVKCGSCAVVLSRSYLLLFSGIMLLIFLFYVLRVGWLGTSLHAVPRGEDSDASWQMFYEECGQRNQLGNSPQAAANFAEHFANRTVKWTGVVKQVKEGILTSNFLFLVMYPTTTMAGNSSSNSTAGSTSSSGSAAEGEVNFTGDVFRDAQQRQEDEDAFFSSAVGAIAKKKRLLQSEGGAAVQKDDGDEKQEESVKIAEEEKGMQGDGADLALAYTGPELTADVQRLDPGDKIQFEATLVKLGRRGKPSLGRLWRASVVETWAQREARLQVESLMHQQQKQFMLQHLLPSMMGSPFSEISEPFSSLLGSFGSLGGRGVVVIRRQIISPVDGSSVSAVISSASTAKDDWDFAGSGDSGASAGRVHKLLMSESPGGGAGGKKDPFDESSFSSHGAALEFDAHNIPLRQMMLLSNVNDDDEDDFSGALAGVRRERLSHQLAAGDATTESESHALASALLRQRLASQSEDVDLELLNEKLRSLQLNSKDDESRHRQGKLQENQVYYGGIEERPRAAAEEHVSMTQDGFADDEKNADVESSADVPDWLMQHAGSSRHEGQNSAKPAGNSRAAAGAGKYQLQLQQADPDVEPPLMPLSNEGDDDPMLAKLMAAVENQRRKRAAHKVEDQDHFQGPREQQKKLQQSKVYTAPKKETTESQHMQVPSGGSLQQQQQQQQAAAAASGRQQKQQQNQPQRGGDFASPHFASVLDPYADDSEEKTGGQLSFSAEPAHGSGGLGAAAPAGAASEPLGGSSSRKSVEKAAPSPSSNSQAAAISPIATDIPSVAPAIPSVTPVAVPSARVPAVSKPQAAEARSV